MLTNSERNVYQPRLQRAARSAGMSPKKYVKTLLAGHVTIAEAAQAAGVSERTLYEWRKRVGLIDE